MRTKLKKGKIKEHKMSLQQEWQYLQRVVGADKEIYRVSENTISSTLVPSLFGEPTTNDSLRQLLANPVRYGGAAIINPVAEAPINLRTSEVCIARIINSLVTGTPFNMTNHKVVMLEG